MTLSRHRRVESLAGQIGILASIGVVLAVMACTTAQSDLEMEPKPIATRLGLPEDCRVSVPLSQADVVDDAKRDGNPNPENSQEWIEMIAMFQPGDQLRLVDCLEVSRSRKVSDPYFYALVRSETIVAKFHGMIVN